jgi:hypothetical protein
LIKNSEKEQNFLKNYSRISSFKLYKWQINTKNDHIMVMNAVVFCKSHGNGNGHGNGHGHGNGYGNGNG